MKQVVAHVPFLVNIASPHNDSWRRSRDRLILEVERAALLGVSAVILHPGAVGDSLRYDGLRRAAVALGEVLVATKELKVRILIENMAGQGSTLCGSFEEIAELLSFVGSCERLGVCFDTAHAFISGYSFAGYTGYEEVMNTFDRVVGVEHIYAFHVNDALTGQGSRHDRHAPIGKGRMGEEVFHALMLDPRFITIPKIVEVPDRDRESLSSLESLRILRSSPAPIPVGRSRSGTGEVQLSFS